MEGTAKCPICGKPYKWYSHYAGDQTACPACVRDAEKGRGKWEHESRPPDRRPVGPFIDNGVGND